MPSICFALPVIPGKENQLRQFGRSLSGEKSQDFAASEIKLGITKETIFLESTPQGNLVLVYLESNDLDAATAKFVQSKDPFDVWFKSQMGEITGQNLNQPPPFVPETLAKYGY
jgi:hypothetical protein